MDFTNSPRIIRRFRLWPRHHGQYASEAARKPKGKGQSQLVKPQPVPELPLLPENPTEEDRAAHQRPSASMSKLA